MLIIKNISYKNLFENISFEVDKGVIGIFGPSGSGKTTFLKIIGGFIQPNNGEIFFQKGKEKFKIQQGKILYNNKGLSDNSKGGKNDLTSGEKINNCHSCENRNLPNNIEFNKKIPGQARDDIQLEKQSPKSPTNPHISIGFHFQDYNLLDLDVKTNIELPFIIGGYMKDDEWLDYLLEYFEIKNLLNKDVSQISGGEKERVSIVRTFINKPNIVLLDEAGAALDERLKNKLYDFIKKYSKENIILSISHDPNFENLLNLNKEIYNGNFKILKQS